VVGAGAGGGVVAKELAVAGLQVVLLERGKWQTFNDHTDDELISQRTTVLGNAFGPDDARYQRVIMNDNGSTRVVLPSEGGYNNVAACVGSGTLSYGAMAWRFMPQDFKMRSTYGQPKGSTLEDWPITYDDLEPCYEKAEWEIGVAGDETDNPFAGPRKKARPMPAFPHNKEAQIVKAAALRLGLHPYPIPMARNSVPYGGRPACLHMRHCVGFACAINAKCGTQNTVIPIALATGNCELRTESVACEVVIDDHGKATGVKYFDANGQLQFQAATLVVVSSSATETARLLLNSRSKLFLKGAGNNNDWVGRNLQGHAYSGARGIFPEDIYEEAGPGASIAFSDFNHGNPGGIVGGGMLCNEFIPLPYLYTNVRPPKSARWGLAHKDFQRKNYKRTMCIMGPVQEVPTFDARIDIDPNVKDHWGIPVARLSGHRHKSDVETGKFLASKAEMVLKEAGATDIWTSTPGMGVSGGQHQAGTCRMGNDPKTSVTNKFGQVHDIDNLFVADGSLNVTNGGFNPALTIMALGYWVGGHIVERFKGSKFA
jgi:choline dehydrogenase-like flavoprotein